MKEPLVSSCSDQNREYQGCQDYQEYPTPSYPLLKDQDIGNVGKKTLVLDLDETLVHSTFQETDDFDYIIPVEIEGNTYSVYVYIRPGVLEFIERMSSLYEIVVYTASLSIVCCLGYSFYLFTYLLSQSINQSIKFINHSFKFTNHSLTHSINQSF